MRVPNPYRFLVECVASPNTPRQLAWGVALGFLIGIVPKANLIAVVLIVVVAALRVNLLAVALSAIVFSFVSPIADPLTHRLGDFLLRRHALQGFWTRMAELPIVPWTDFNNTVVLGSLVTGLVLLFPAYWICSRLMMQWQTTSAEPASGQVRTSAS